MKSFGGFQLISGGLTESCSFDSFSRPADKAREVQSLHSLMGFFRRSLGHIEFMILYYVIVHYFTLCYATLHSITLRYITSHYITLHYITLHYITLHYITLHYITLHYNPFILY